MFKDQIGHVVQKWSLDTQYEQDQAACGVLNCFN